MRIAATGLSGLVGSRVEELLAPKYEFVPIGLSRGVDITNKDSILKAVKDSRAEIILNLAAKADVDGCEQDKPLGKNGQAWKVNAEGAENIALACKEFGKKLIHISTDFVFDGEKDYYTEEDIPNPIDWYGRTKLEGEKLIEKVNPEFIIARIAYPYRASFQKKDFVRAMFSRLALGQEIKAVVDHIMTPTFIDDIAFALDCLFEKGTKGIYHICGGGPISPYDAALLICNKLSLDKSLVLRTTRQEYFENKAQRPFRLYLKNDRIGKLGLKMRTLAQGLEEIKGKIS